MAEVSGDRITVQFGGVRFQTERIPGLGGIDAGTCGDTPLRRGGLGLLAGKLQLGSWRIDPSEGRPP